MNSESQTCENERSPAASSGFWDVDDSATLTLKVSAVWFLSLAAH